MGDGSVISDQLVLVSTNTTTLQAVVKVAPALSAGCAVLLKPSPLASLSCVQLGELAIDAGLPRGALAVVTGGPPGGAADGAAALVRAARLDGSLYEHSARSPTLLSLTLITRCTTQSSTTSPSRAAAPRGVPCSMPPPTRCAPQPSNWVARVRCSASTTTLTRHASANPNPNPNPNANPTPTPNPSPIPSPSPNPGSNPNPNGCACTRQAR